MAQPGIQSKQTIFLFCESECREMATQPNQIHVTEKLKINLKWAGLGSLAGCLCSKCVASAAGVFKTEFYVLMLYFHGKIRPIRWHFLILEDQFLKQLSR